MILALGVILATAITLAIFSRVWRDNTAFRIVGYVLLGALGGYVAAIVLREVLWPGLTAPLFGSPADWIVGVGVPLLLILLLALRFVPKPEVRSLGLIPLGFLLGAGGALVLAGALRGTLIPQLLVASVLSYLPAAPPMIDTLTVVIATLTTISVIVYFQQRSESGNAPTSRFLAGFGKLGYYALMIAFGALLATTAGARITLLIDRVQYLERIWSQLLG